MENPSANRIKIEYFLSVDHSETDIILLPEMFSTGFSMNLDLAETMNGVTVDWLKKIAVSKDSAIAGSISVKENGCYYNRFI